MDDENADVGDVVDDSIDLEASVAAKQSREALERALAALPREDAAIVRLRFIQGLSLKNVQSALHLKQLTEDRVAGIVEVLRTALEGSGS